MNSILNLLEELKLNYPQFTFNIDEEKPNELFIGTNKGPGEAWLLIEKAKDEESEKPHLKYIFNFGSNCAFDSLNRLNVFSSYHDDEGMFDQLFEHIFMHFNSTENNINFPDSNSMTRNFIGNYWRKLWYTNWPVF